MAAPVYQMAKKKNDDSTPSPAPPADQAAKVAGDVLRMARIIVAAGGAQSVTKLISDTCRPIFARRLKELRDAGQLGAD